MRVPSLSLEAELIQRSMFNIVSTFMLALLLDRIFMVYVCLCLLVRGASIPILA